MKKLLFLFVLFSGLAHAQFIPVQGTIRDSNNQVFSSCTWSVVFSGSANSKVNGQSFTQSFSGTCDSTGYFRVILPQNSQITPKGSSWTFSFCNSTGIFCGSASITVGNSSPQDISVLLRSAAPTLPAAVSFIDFVANPSPPANPVTSSARAFYDSANNTFEVLDSSGTNILFASSANFASPPPIGNTTPNSSVFTTMQGTLVDDGGQTFDVRSFGAICNGTADDNTAVHAAFTAAAAQSSGRTVYIPGNCTVSSTIHILTRGMTVKGAYGGRNSDTGGTAISYTGTGPLFEIGTPKITTITSISRTSNVVTVNYAALPAGAGSFAVGGLIDIADVTDSSFNGTDFTVVSTPSSTQLTYAQTASNASSSGGTIAGNPASGDFDGVQEFSVRNVDLQYTGSSTTPLLNGAGVYGTGTYGIQDNRGGGIRLTNVLMEHFQYGFWGVQSDIDTFSDFDYRYCSVGFYLGPRSDQANLFASYTFRNDLSTWLDGADGFRGWGVQTVNDGSAHTPAFRVSNNITLYGEGDIWYSPWMEHSGGGGGTVPIQDNFIEYGSVNGVADTNAASNLKIIRPRIATKPQNQTPRVTYFMEVGNADYVRVEDPLVESNLLASLFNFVGSTSPIQIEATTLSPSGADSFTLATFSGSGNPKPHLIETDSGFYSFKAPTDNSAFYTITAGKTTTQSAGYAINNYTGACNWEFLETTSGFGRLSDCHNNQTRIEMTPNGAIGINSFGSGSININQSTSAATGVGLKLYLAGASPSIADSLNDDGTIQFGMNTGGANFGKLSGTFTAGRTFTFPDTSGTIALLASPTFTTSTSITDNSFGSVLSSTATACETSFATTTLNTGGTTTDTGLNCLPANSIIDFVVARVTTTITASCTGWELGDASTPARFSSNNTTLTSGTVTDAAHIGTFNNTGIASATTGIWQATAAKVRITCAGGNPGAGAIRVIVYSHTPTAPTS